MYDDRCYHSLFLKIAVVYMMLPTGSDKCQHVIKSIG